MWYETSKWFIHLNFPIQYYSSYIIKYYYIMMFPFVLLEFLKVYHTYKVHIWKCTWILKVKILNHALWWTRICISVLLLIINCHPKVWVHVNMNYAIVSYALNFFFIFAVFSLNALLLSLFLLASLTQMHAIIIFY